MTSFLRPVRKRCPRESKVPEIAGEEPTVLEDSGRRVRTIPVSFHHDCAAQRDFSDRRAFFLRLRIDNLRFNAFQGFSNRSDFIVVGRVGEDRCCRLSKAISLKDVDSQIVEGAADCRIETRSAGHQIAHLRAKCVVYFPEEHAACVDANLPQDAVDCDHGAEDLLRDGTPLRNLLHDTLMDQVEELRDHRECRDVAFVQGSQQFGGVQRLKVDDARSLDQRQH